MMAAQHIPSTVNGASPVRLINRLPDVRGRYNEDVPLGQSTWFKVGGPAEVVFRPADEKDLSDFLAEKPADVAITVIGVASNLLVRDGGISGVVIRLGREFTGVSVDDDIVTAGAGGLDMNVAMAGIPERRAGHHWRRSAHERRGLWVGNEGYSD